MGSTAETGITEAQVQLADTPGRIARAAPLFLAEQIHLRTSALCQVIQPWINPGNFLLSGQPWEAETAIDQAKSCQPSSDYVLLIHLVATGSPYHLSFRLIRCIDGSVLDNPTFQLDPENLEPTFDKFANHFLQSICHQAHAERIEPSQAYQVPTAPWFNDYQLRLEQALAVRAGAMDDTRRDFLSGEREIIGGMLHLCLATPNSVSARIMLFDSLRRMKTINPKVVEEFRDKLAQFQREYPAPTAAHAVLDKMLAEITSP